MSRNSAERTRRYRARLRARTGGSLRRPGENIDRAGRPWRILTDDQVREIRARLADPGGPSQAELARTFGIDPSTISRIGRGQRRGGAA